MRRFEKAVAVISFGILGIIVVFGPVMSSFAKEPLVIAASPSLAPVLKALGHAYEAKRPEVEVQLHFNSGLELRQAIAGMHNSGRHFIETGPFHLVAPGGDELIDRLEQRYYVLPGTRKAYAAVPLVLVAPESLVEAPTSFDALAEADVKRVAVADPARTQLGKETQNLLRVLGLDETLKGKMDVAADARGVLDHVLSGQADAGILFGPDAVRERDRVRITAVAPQKGYRPAVHSMAMERYCPDRKRCADFLDFIQTPEAQVIVKQLGYQPAANGAASSALR